MKKQLLIAGAIAIAAATTTPAQAGVGVSVSIGEPGFYGQLDIGDYYYPQPQVIYTQPVVIAPMPRALPPVYLRARPEEIRNWRYSCGAYNACGRNVYFVQDRWYSNVYAPRYQEYHHGAPYARHDDYRGSERHDMRHDDRRGGRFDDRRDGRHEGRHNGHR
jgi:hypothetical protein